jgi:hypothetical protein
MAVNTSRFKTPEDRRIEQLEEALRAILEGTLMDVAGNRNEDGLVDMSHARGPTKAHVHQWLKIAKDGLKNP